MPFRPGAFRPPLDLGPFTATNTKAAINSDSGNTMRVTQTYDVTISSGDPANQFARATQTYNVAISSGDPLVQFVRPTQTYVVTISSGDPLIQFARVSQTYLTVIYEPAVPIPPLLQPRRLMPPLRRAGPFARLQLIEALDSQSLPPAPVSRGRNHCYIL